MQFMYSALTCMIMMKPSSVRRDGRVGTPIPSMQENLSVYRNLNSCNQYGKSVRRGSISIDVVLDFKHQRYFVSFAHCFLNRICDATFDVHSVFLNRMRIEAGSSL